MKRGRLIAIEGIDQAGKRTQANLLDKEIRKTGRRVSLWNFPEYSTPLGRQLKAYLARKIRLDLHAVHLLYAANRWEVAERLRQELGSGKVIIVNRYWPSNLAYGVAHGLSLSWLGSLDEGLPKPDLVVVLDISLRTSLARKRKGRDAHERNLHYLKKVRSAYLRLAKKHGWRVVYGQHDLPTVHDALWEIVAPLLV